MNKYSQIFCPVYCPEIFEEKKHAFKQLLGHLWTIFLVSLSPNFSSKLTTAEG
jgi:hypothetical protein